MSWKGLSGKVANEEKGAVAMRENAVGELVVMGVRGEVWVVRWVVRELHTEVHTWSIGVFGPGFWLSAPPSWGLWSGWVFWWRTTRPPRVFRKLGLGG